MSNIKYNEKQEAYELPYKLWNREINVRFYTESEDDIMANLSEIAMKLETINGGKGKLSRMLADDGIYEGAAEKLSKSIVLDDIYADIDDDEIVFCFTVSSGDGYMKPQNIELYDTDFEIVGNVY